MTAPSFARSFLSGEARYDPHEISRARAVIQLNLVCALAFAVINLAAALWLQNARPIGVSAAALAMTAVWMWVLHQIVSGRMERGVVGYTVSGPILLVGMGLSVPELSLLFTFATFIFLAFGLSYMGGRASVHVVALTLACALVLLLVSVAFRWTSGVPDNVFRWVNLTGMLMALSIDATMFVMLRRTLEARAQHLVEVERGAAEMQQRLAQQERLESIGKLAGGVAHDFNNLLAVILNYAAFVAEEVSDRPDVLSDIESVRSAAQRAAALTRQLLIFGRREIVHGDVIDISRVVSDTEALLRSALGEHIDLRTKLPDSVPLVQMDTSRVEQVLLNLSVNARDAMPNGGTLVIEVAESTFTREGPGDTTPKAGHYVSLSVSDTGTGFTEDARQHLFEPFFTTKPAGRGTGLGLATVYGIAMDAGGDVQLYSELGVGTTVRVYVPVAEQAVAGPVAPVRGGQVARGDGRTVLLVEDQFDLRQVTSRMLAGNGYRVRAAESPDDAVRILAGDTPISVLLTDVVMPGMSGLQLAERAAELRPDLPVLYMSGFPRDMWAETGPGPNMAIIEKPFDAEQLLRRVDDALNHVEQPT